MRKYPEGTKFGCYFINKEPNDLSIRQTITLPDGTRRNPRFPAKQYAHIPRTKEALQPFVDKLNYGLDLKKQRYQEIQSAIIPPRLFDTFYAQLKNEIPNDKDRRYLFNTLLKKYFLDFFINKLKVLDPKEWIKRQADWGVALTGDSTPDRNIFDKKVSAKTIKATIQIANRFMAFLRTQNPEEYPIEIQFRPFSKEALKTYSTSLDDEEIGQYIPASDWKKINKKLPINIGCFIRMMYFYGLRRSESMGFVDVSSVRKGHLHVSQQLKSFSGDPDSDYDILKDKERRDTPHWFCTPAQCYRFISDGLDKKMHPDTLSQKWDEFAEGLGMTYKLHDFRRTFITNALRKYPARDVQLAVGHANIATTMGYAQDDRDLDNEVWSPKTG